MVKNTKTSISWEWNIPFLKNKKNLNMGLRWHILRSCGFVAEVTFKVEFSLFVPGEQVLLDDKTSYLSLMDDLKL